MASAESTWAKGRWLSGRYDVADYAGGSSERNGGSLLL